MVGNQYQMFGTDNIFEIIGEKGEYWKVLIRSSEEQRIGVLITKQDLNDSVMQGSLIKRTGA